MAALGLQTAPDIRKARRLVVKIGSALLVDRVTGLKTAWLTALALDVAEAKARGADVVLVSSGSIALGRKVLGLPDGALTLEQSQAAAAVGHVCLVCKKKVSTQLSYKKNQISRVCAEECWLSALVIHHGSFGNQLLKTWYRNTSTFVDAIELLLLLLVVTGTYKENLHVINGLLGTEQ